MSNSDLPEITIKKAYRCQAPLAFCQKTGIHTHPSKAMKSQTKIIDKQVYFDGWIPFSESKDFVPEIKKAVYVEWEPIDGIKSYMLTMENSRCDIQHTVSPGQHSFFFADNDIGDLKQELIIVGLDFVREEGRFMSRPVLVAQSKPFRIEEISITDDSGKTMDCPICLENLSNDDIEVTKCNHKFHASCMAKTNHKCPMCRENL